MDYCSNYSKALTSSLSIKRLSHSIGMDLHMFQAALHFNWPEKMEIRHVRALHQATDNLISSRKHLTLSAICLDGPH